MILILAIGLATGCVYALIAVGYSLEYRTTGVINFSEGNYVMIGGFSTFWFLNHAQLPYPLAILAGVLVTTTVRPRAVVVRRAATLATAQPALCRAARHHRVRCDPEHPGAPASRPDAADPAAWIPGFSLVFGESRIDGQYIVVVVLTLVLMAAIVATLQFTPIGRQMRACAASRDTSELLGISPERMGLFSFAATAPSADWPEP